MDHKLMMKMITLITLSYICSSISAQNIAPSTSPAPSTSSPSIPNYTYDTLADLMCAHYDPKATMESVNNDPAIKDICDTTEKPAECLDFLGNSPKANPVFAIGADVDTLKTFLTEASQGASGTPPADVKESFDTCVRNYNEVANKLAEVVASCAVCTQRNGKCPPQEATKITTALNDSLAGLGLCGKALDATTAKCKRWLVNVNVGATESVTKILEVAKKLT